MVEGKQTKLSHRLRINHNRAHKQIQIQIHLQIDKLTHTHANREETKLQPIFIAVKTKGAAYYHKMELLGGGAAFLGRGWLADWLYLRLFVCLSEPGARFHTKDTINDNT